MSARRPLLRRLFPSPALSLTVVAFWMVMSSSFDLGQLLLGMLRRMLANGEALRQQTPLPDTARSAD